MRKVLTISETVVGVLSSSMPLTVASVWGMRHVVKEWPLALPLSLCAYNYSQLSVEAAAMAGFSENSFPQVQKVSFLCDQEKLRAYGSDYEILFLKKLLTESV